MTLSSNTSMLMLARLIRPRTYSKRRKRQCSPRARLIKCCIRHHLVEAATFISQEEAAVEIK